jgi:hypothetical protein
MNDDVFGNWEKSTVFCFFIPSFLFRAHIDYRAHKSEIKYNPFFLYHKAIFWCFRLMTVSLLCPKIV